MKILKEYENFVVPVRYVDMEDLDIVILEDIDILGYENINIATRVIKRNFDKGENLFRNNREKKPVASNGVSQDELDDIKWKIKKQIEYYFIQIKDFAENLTSEQLLEMHTTIFKDIWMAHVNNIPCFEKVKQRPNLDKILEAHIDKFKKIFNFHYNKFKCQEFDNVKKPIVTAEEIQIASKEATIEIEIMFKNMFKMLENLSVEQVGEIHEFILTTVVEEDIENIPCFKKMASTLNLDKLTEKHKRFIGEKFNEHLNRLGCEK